MAGERDKEYYALRGGPNLLTAMEPDKKAIDVIDDNTTIVKELQAMMPALLKSNAAAVQLDENGGVTNITTRTV